MKGDWRPWVTAEALRKVGLTDTGKYRISAAQLWCKRVVDDGWASNEELAEAIVEMGKKLGPFQPAAVWHARIDVAQAVDKLRKRRKPVASKLGSIIKEIGDAS